VTTPKQRPAIPFPSKEADVNQGHAEPDQIDAPDDLVSRCQAGDVGSLDRIAGAIK